MSLTSQQRAEVLQIVQQNTSANYLSGSPAIPPHTHNGVDNLQIPYSNITSVPRTTGGGLNGYQVFTASGTFTVPTGFTNFLVQMVGGGASGHYTGGEGGLAGGNAGDFCSKLCNLSGTSTVTVTIGSGGSATTAYSNGGDTTFGSIFTAKGGGSSTTSTGDLVVTGGTGGNGFQWSNSGGYSSYQSGCGGNSYFGGGGASASSFVGGSPANGGSGTAYGSGGAGNACGHLVAGSSNVGAGVSGVTIISW